MGNGFRWGRRFGRCNQLSPLSPTLTDPIKGYISDPSNNTNDLMMEVYFDSDGDFVVKSYDYDDNGNKFHTLSTFEDLRDWKAFDIDSMALTILEI